MNESSFGQLRRDRKTAARFRLQFDRDRNRVGCNLVRFADRAMWLEEGESVIKFHFERVLPLMEADVSEG